MIFCCSSYIKVLQIATLLFVFFSISVSSQQTSFNASYEVKKFTYLTRELKYVEISIDFDNIDYHLTLPETPEGTKNTTFRRCCREGDDPNVDDCVDGESVGLACEDDLQPLHKTTNFTETHFAWVNPDCDYFAFNVVDLGADSKFTYVFKSASELRTAQRENLRVHDSEILSCTDIRNKNTNWQGLIIFVVEPVKPDLDRLDTYVYFHTSLALQTQSFPLPNYFHLQPITLTCGNELNIDFKCDEPELVGGPGVCTPLPGSNEPIPTYFGVYSGVLTGREVLPNRVALALPLSENIDLLQDKLYFPEPLFQSGCHISFPGFADTSQPITLSTRECDIDTWHAISSGIERTAELLSNSTDIENVGSMLTRYYSDSGYQVCLKHMNRFLTETEDSVAWLNTTECLPLGADLMNPCCNPHLEEDRCCVVYSLAQPQVLRTRNEPALVEHCSVPGCMNELVDNYAAILDQDKLGCLETENVPLLITENLVDDLCFNKVFRTGRLRSCTDDKFCEDYFNGPAYCSIDGQCFESCETTDDCLDTCVNGTCVKEDFQTYDPTAKALLAKCLDIEAPGLTMLFFRRLYNLTDNATAEEVELAMFERYSVHGCEGSFATTKEECAMIESCSWAACNPSSQFCTKENCETDVLSDYCCVQCNDVLCFEIGGPELCSVEIAVGGDPNQAELMCDDLGGEWVALRVTGGRCVFPNKTREECTPSSFCEPDAASCSSHCAVPPLPGDECGPFPFVVPLTFSNGTETGICVNRFLARKSDCDAQGGTWYPGGIWETASLETQEKCEGSCGSDPTLTNEKDCICGRPCPNCTIESCLDEEGTCNDPEGCFWPYVDDARDCVGTGWQWTPLGCLDVNITSRAACEGTWIEKAMDGESCRAKSRICKEDILDNVKTNVSTEEKPTAYTFKSQSECEACGSRWVNYYEWTSSVDTTVWLSYNWIRRYWGVRGRWVRTSFELGSEFQDAGALHMNIVLNSELLCKHKKKFSLVSSVLDDCGVGTPNPVAVVSSEDLRVFAADAVTNCDTLPRSVEFQRVGVMHSTVELANVGGTNCVTTNFFSIPISQFKTRKEIKLGSSGIPSTQDGKESDLFYKNKNGIAVGILLKDGVRIAPERKILSGLRFCFITEDIALHEVKELDLKSFDVAVHTGGDKRTNNGSTLFELMHLTQTDEGLCFDVEETETYFLIGLEDGYENKEYPDTYTDFQIALFVIGAIISFLLLAVTIYELVGYFVGRVNSLPPKISLTLLAVFLLDRFIYFIILPLGEIEGNDEVNIIFAELPTLIFFSIYSIICAKWAEIYHHSMKVYRGDSPLTRLTLAANAFMYCTFLIFIVAFFALDDGSETFSCAIDSGEFDSSKLTNREIVAIIYKAFFTLICLIFVGLFIFYGLNLSQKLNANSDLTNNAATHKAVRRRQLMRMVVITLICSVCLLGQAARLLYDVLEDDKSITGTTIWIILVSLFPSCLLLWLLAPSNIFNKARPLSSTKSRSRKTGVSMSKKSLDDMSDDDGTTPSINSDDTL